MYLKYELYIYTLEFFLWIYTFDVLKHSFAEANASILADMCTCEIIRKELHYLTHTRIGILANSTS